MTDYEQWHKDRVQMWQNLCDALNALEAAGERPGLNLVEEDGRIVRRYIDGEWGCVNHNISDADPAWTLEVAVDVFGLKVDDRVLYDDNAGTVRETLPAGGLTPVERATVEWDNGTRSTVWVSDLIEKTP